MPLDLAAYEQKARKAVTHFWSSREKARDKQEESGKSNQGERAGVTGGGNMNGFVDLVVDIVKANGLAHAEIHEERNVLTPAWLLSANEALGPARGLQRRVDRRG